MLEWHRALFDAYGSMIDDGYLVQNGIMKGESARKLAGGGFKKGIWVPMSFKALVLEIWCRNFSAL